MKALLPFHVTLILIMIYYNIVGYNNLAGDYINITNDPGQDLGARIFSPQNGSPSEGKDRHLSELRQIHLPHGTFYFGPHSHQSIDISKTNNHTSSWTAAQAQLLLNDETIDFLKEKERCESYNFNFPKNRTTINRRRLFLGSLIASDSIEVIKAVGTESYNIFHVVSFVESNSTQTLAPREWRFLEERNDTTTEDEDEDHLLRPAMKSLVELYQLFGPKTQV